MIAFTFRRLVKKHFVFLLESGFREKAFDLWQDEYTLVLEKNNWEISVSLYNGQNGEYKPCKNVGVVIEYKLDGADECPLSQKIFGEMEFGKIEANLFDVKTIDKTLLDNLRLELYERKPEEQIEIYGNFLRDNMASFSFDK